MRRSIPILGLAVICTAAAGFRVEARPASKARPAARGRRAPKPYQPAFKSTEEAENLAYERINQIRINAGLKPLRLNPRLTELARAYSRQMAEERFFEHVTPAGVTLDQRINTAGLRWTRIGENIYKSYNHPDPVRGAVEGWMNSPGHKKNILNPDYTETGMGAYVKDREVYFTQDFMRGF